MWKGRQISFSESLSRILPAIANRIDEKMPGMGKFSPMPYYFDVEAGLRLEFAMKGKIKKQTEPTPYTK